MVGNSVITQQEKKNQKEGRKEKSLKGWVVPECLMVVKMKEGKKVK